MYRRDNADHIEKQFGFALDKINNNDCRFHAIYFVDSFSGSLLLSKRYTAKSSFLSDFKEDNDSGSECKSLYLKYRVSSDERVPNLSGSDLTLL